MYVIESQRQVRPEMSSAEHELWRTLIHTRCGLFFTDSRLYFLEQRLWERMSELNLKNYADYYYYIVHNPAGGQEWLTLQDAILNNESSFMRHQPSYDALIKHALPDLMSRKLRSNDTMLTLWSAGCSGGQEPYSLAMAALQQLDPVVWDIQVVGTDISRTQLAKAKMARYKQYEVRYMPAYFRDNYMRCHGDASKRSAVFSINASVRRLVRFNSLNLHDPDAYWLAAQDIIFCQNVLIYFKPVDRIKIVERLADRLNPGGYLFLGPAEVVGLRLPRLKLIRWENVLVYQRVG